MSDELRPVWVCVGDGCGLRVRNEDGRPIPEPKRWKDGRCAACRVELERVTNGQSAANKLHDKLHGIRRRPGPFSHSDPEFEDGPKEPKPERKPRNEPTPEQIERVETDLENTFDTDRGIAERVGVSIGRVCQARERLNLPSAPERRAAARRKKLEEFFSADPARLQLNADEIAEALGTDPHKVRGDRLALGLGIGRGHGQRKAEPKPTTSHGGKRARRARLSRVRAYVEEHPEAMNREVAEALGLTERRVQKDRLVLGLSRMSGMPKSAT